jgi:hypothetical protein
MVGVISLWVMGFFSGFFVSGSWDGRLKVQNIYIRVLSAELVFLSSLWGAGLMIKKLMMDGELYFLESV